MRVWGWWSFYFFIVCIYLIIFSIENFLLLDMNEENGRNNDIRDNNN